MDSAVPATQLGSDAQAKDRSGQPSDAGSKQTSGPSPRPVRAPSRSNRISSLILFAVIALAPLPFGSTEPTTVAFWCIALGAGLLAAVPRALNRRQLSLLALAGVIVAAYSLVLHEQLSSHPWFAGSHALWRQASDAFATELEPSVSIARNLPFFALGAPLAAMLTLILSFVISADHHKARQLMQVVAWSGAAYALFGIFSFLIDPTKILWREKQAYTTVLTAPFINRNTAAVYFGACSVIWLLMVCEQVRQRLPRGKIEWRAVPRRLFSDMPRIVIVSFSMMFLCLAAMFMTGSRAGVVLSLMAMVLSFTLYFRRDLPSKSGLVSGVLGACGVALILLQLMGAGVSGRLDAQALADGGRLATYRSTLRMIADHPWFGTGLGTFPWAFPAYRSADVSMWGIWDRAHSTPLEMAAELGIPLAGLIVVGWLVALAVLIRGAFARRALVVPVAALSVGSLAVLHSLIDFSLQIPGFTIVALAVVGSGLAGATRDSGQEDQPAAEQMAELSHFRSA